MKSNQPKSELVFTNALKKLLDNINGKYGSRGKEFSTKPLLNKMPNGPKQNFSVVIIKKMLKNFIN